MKKKRNVFGYLSAALLTVSMLLTPTLHSYADTLGSGSQSYRVNVLNAVGVADSTWISEDVCTRAWFAKLLALSSTLHDTASAVSGTSVASDVPATYDKSGYIKIALTNDWMRTRLSGAFAPEEAVTLSDAARATLKMLGYEDSDMGSNVTAGRIALFKSLNLNEGVSASNASDKLTYTDAVNVIYNLLRTKSKGSSSIYGQSLNLTLSSTGNELNATEAVETTLVGPILIKHESELKQQIPFYGDADIKYYYNGVNTAGAGSRYLSSQLNNQGWAIVYYSEKTKTVWTYGADTGDNAYHCVRGKVTSILYDSDDITAPTSVILDATEYDLNSSEVRFMFSISGDVKTGDDVVLICKTNTNPQDEDETDYYAIAVVEYYPQQSNLYSSTIYTESGTGYVIVNADGQIINE